MDDLPTANLTKTTRRAIARYTERGCYQAYILNECMGEGPHSIATNHDLPLVTTTNAADAAINAGRELAAVHGLRTLRIKYAGL